MKETKRKPEERPCVHSPHFSLTSATQSFFFAAGFRLLHWNTASSKPWSVSQLLISCTRCGKGKYECMTWTRLSVPVSVVGQIQSDYCGTQQGYKG